MKDLPCILVVEDNDINAMLLMHFLSTYDNKIERVHNGQQAVDFVLTNPVAVIMMDINMPIMDGCQATKIIRALESITQPHIVAVTADATKATQERCQSVGMNDFLAKPFNAEQLKTLMDPVIGNEIIEISATSMNI